MSPDRRVVDGVAGADAALVFVEGHVQAPGARVLDALVAASGLPRDPCLRRPAGKAGAGLRGHLRSLSLWGLGQDRAVPVGPGPVGGHGSELCRGSARAWSWFTVLWQSWGPPSRTLACSTAAAARGSWVRAGGRRPATHGADRHDAAGQAPHRSRSGMAVLALEGASTAV